MTDHSSIDNPIRFFRDAGGLHDSEIEKLEWEFGQYRVSLSLRDLHANFRGHADYPQYPQGERTPATLVFEGVTAFSTDISPADCHRYVYDVEAQQHADELRIRIRCSPGGIMDLVCRTVAITVETRQ
jgi:hypothetical protein